MERRDFFKFLGGGLVLLLALDGDGERTRIRTRCGDRGDARPPELAAWLHIGEDGTITVYTGKVEVGQNIRTSLAQAVAEELRAPIGAVQLVMADTDLTPYDMGTFGSRTTPLMAPQMKKVGAAAREALIDLAADKWKVDRASISVAGGKVKNNASGESVGFGELTRGQKLVKTVDGAAVTPPAEWTLEGTSAPKVNARDMVTGAHRYTSDLVRPGMLHGRVLRPPAFKAKLASFDAKEAGEIPDVLVVRDGDFVGAVAPDEVTLSKAISAIKTEWSTDAAAIEQRTVRLSQRTCGSQRGQNGAAGAARMEILSKGLQVGRSQAGCHLHRRSTLRMFHWSRARRWPNGTRASSRFGPAHSARGA